MDKSLRECSLTHSVVRAIDVLVVNVTAATLNFVSSFIGTRLCQ